MGIHGTLFYDNELRRKHIPVTKREFDWDDQGINHYQRALFARYRQRPANLSCNNAT